MAVAFVVLCVFFFGELSSPAVDFFIVDFGAFTTSSSLTELVRATIRPPSAWSLVVFFAVVLVDDLDFLSS